MSPTAPAVPRFAMLCPAALPALSTPPVHAHSQWTLPTPAVTYNPYAQRPSSVFHASAGHVCRAAATGLRAAADTICLSSDELPCARCSAMASPASRLPITHESLETHREISAPSTSWRALRVAGNVRESRPTARAGPREPPECPRDSRTARDAALPQPYTVPQPYAVPAS